MRLRGRWGGVLVRWVMSICALGGGVTAAWAAARFEASLEPDTIVMGQACNLTLTFIGSKPDQVPTIPAVADLRITSVGQSQQLSFGPGGQSASFSYNYVVSPMRPGTFTIPAIRAQVSGSEVTSAPLQLKVLEPGREPPATQRAGQSAFLRLLVSKREVFLGEVLPVEIQLYTLYDEPRQAPQLAQEGFTLGRIVAVSQRTSLVGTRYYNQLLFRTYVSPAKTGSLSLGPATLPVLIPDSSAGTDWFGRPRRWIEVRLSSDPVQIEALPLPADRVPPNFTGAVGNYTMETRISTNRVAMGDPITVTVKIAGDGPVEPLTLKSLDDWADFKVYPPVTRTENQDALGLGGVKTFEQVVIPETTAVREVPAITFSFFDPAAKRYRTLSHPATPLTVMPAGQAPPQPTIVAGRSEQASTAIGTELVHIKSRPGTLAQVRPPLVLRPGFFVLQLLPVAAWLGAVLWRRRQSLWERNPRLRRRREVGRLVKHGLKALSAQAVGRDTEAFFATVFHLLQEQLGERLDLPAASITEAVLDERLQPAGVDPETLSVLHELFHICNQARYAPEASVEELDAWVPQVRAALERVRDLKL